MEFLAALETCEETSAIIGARVIEAEATEEKISSARERYRTVATRGSCLYFVVADLANIDPMYQFSLKYFNQVFTSVITSSPPADELEARLQILLQEITLAIYTNVSRGLFERHKLVFSFMLCTSIFKNAGSISEAEWSFLLRGALAGSVVDPPKKPNLPTLSDVQWMNVIYLSVNFHPFERLPYECTNKIIINVGDFEQVIQLDLSNIVESKVDWNEKLSLFERMMILKALKEEKLCAQVYLLLLDNVPTYKGDLQCKGESDIKLLFLPPNITSLLQTMGQGITDSPEEEEEAEPTPTTSEVLQSHGERDSSVLVSTTIITRLDKKKLIQMIF
ncbi:hypothetical protein J6590_017548 [Homalodisca vitripennis]|nr:hypothetical protein J6590_017548 [Homalodisca vitripennis]